MEPTYKYIECDEYEEFYEYVELYLKMGHTPVFIEIIFGLTSVYYVVCKRNEVPEVTRIPLGEFEAWYSEYSYMPEPTEFVAETFRNPEGYSTMLSVIAPVEIGDDSEGGLLSC